MFYFSKVWNDKFKISEIAKTSLLVGDKWVGGKLVVLEGFIRTFKGKMYRKMTQWL